jgi:hypothetical protein
MINNWVKSFLEPTEKAFLEIGTKINQEKLELEELKKFGDPKLARFTQNHIQLLKTAADGIQAQIDADFANYFQSHVQKYFSLDGFGLFVYLEENTTIKLVDFMKRKS